MDQDYGMSDFLKRIDAIFMGRKSYELTKKIEGPNPWKGMLTYVFSNSMKELNDKDTKLVSGDIKTEVTAIKKSKGKDIWLFGGAQLTTTFINDGLVDELWLAIHPILLGGGKALFQGIKNRVKTKLVETKTYGTGLVLVKYEIEGVGSKG